MRIKYPRTPHLPWSPGASDDDVRLLDATAFEGREVVVTEKLDGENTSLYRTGLHARSLDSAHHPSRAWVKALQARIGPLLPEGYRVCGENLAARHSIAYDGLLSWFYGFGVWDGPRCLDWDATTARLDSLGIPTPPVLYRGTWDKRAIRTLKVPAQVQEGYVVRTVAGFDLEDFDRHCAKWVRPDHVQSDTHWMLRPVVPNGLAPEAALWEVRSGGVIDADALWALLELPGERAEPLDLGGTGTPRLALALASLVSGGSPHERLPHLARRLPVPLAVRVHRLCALHERLRNAVDDATRAGGLVSLARSADLRALHALAERGADDAQREQVQWSRLVADEAGLLDPEAIERWVGGLRALLPALSGDRWSFVRGDALTAWASGAVRSPEEAAARAHPHLERTPPRLTVMVGPAGTGKSAVAAGLGGRVISLDGLRGAPAQTSRTSCAAASPTSIGRSRGAAR
jgi:hypothetical protein